MSAASYRQLMMSSARVATAFKKALGAHLMQAHKNDEDEVDKIMRGINFDEMIQLFMQSDENESGDIDLKETIKTIAKLGHAIPEEKVKELLSFLGDSGVLNLWQFLNLILMVREVVKGRVEEPKEKRPSRVLRWGQGKVKSRKRGSLHLRIEVGEMGGDRILKLTAIEGKNLVAMDAGGTSDPYIKATVLQRVDGERNSTQKTHKVMKTLNPRWDQCLSWVLPRGDIDGDAKLLVSVWDYNVFLRDNFMGAMAFPLPAIVVARATEGWFLLLDDQQGLQYHFRDLTGGAGGIPPTPSPMHSSPAAAAKHSAADYSILKLLGQGGFSKIFLAEHVRTHQLVTLKCIKKTLFLSEDEPAEAMQAVFTEERVLSMAPRSPFVVHLLAAFQTPACLFFVMELAGGGNLLSLSMLHGKMPDKSAAFYVGEIVLGLEYLHKRSIVHRDLKQENVVLDMVGHAKLADLGSAKDLRLSAPAMTFCGTPNAMAPEIYKREPYSYPVDWWALGCLTYELLVGRPLFEGDDEQELHEAVVKEDIEFAANLTPAADDFLHKLIERDAGQRLGSRGTVEVRMHAFLNANVTWPQLEARTVPPPYSPREKNLARCEENFNPEMTSRAPVISPVKRSNLQLIDQTLFVGFSYVAEDMH